MEKHIQQLHEQFQTYGRNAREWMRKCELLLPAIERERVWEKKGFGSIHEYAGKLAGMSRDRVNDVLRAMHKAESMPDIMQIIEERGVNVIRPIIALLNQDNQSFWADKARQMGKTTLEAYVREVRSGCTSTSKNDDFPDQKAITKTIIPMDLDPDVATQLTKLKGTGDWNGLMKEFLERREAMLEQVCPESKTTDSRHIPTAIQKFIIQRSRGICEFPKCTRTYTILHHTQRFALEKTHDPTRITALCTSHERIVHQGLVENEEKQPSEWRVRQHPDTQNPTYAIDQLVMKYRRPG